MHLPPALTDFGMKWNVFTEGTGAFEGMGSKTKILNKRETIAKRMFVMSHNDIRKSFCFKIPRATVPQ